MIFKIMLNELSRVHIIFFADISVLLTKQQTDNL